MSMSAGTRWRFLLCTSPSAAPDDETLFKMFCNTGERALCGGAAGEVGAPPHSYPLEADRTLPATGETPTGWLTIFRSTGTTPSNPVGYVVCARP